MNNNIFHIGYHKTATTWFQKNFYPFVNHISFIERQKIRSYFYENNIENFDSNIHQVFCDEELSGNIHNGGLSGFLTDNVAQKISKFNNPKVIIFIRNQYDIIASSYMQYVKEGGNYSISKYISHSSFPRSNRSALFSYAHFDYYRLIKLYESLIGKENIYVYLFEDFVQDNKGFISEFIKDHDFDILIEDLDFISNNRSYSYLSYRLARFFNCFTREKTLFKYYILHIPYLYKYVREILSRISFSSLKPRNLLTKKIKREILSYYKLSNSNLSKEYGFKLRDLGYPI